MSTRVTRYSNIEYRPSSTVRIGNNPTGPQYEVLRNGNNLTSKKNWFALHFTRSVCVIKAKQLIFLKEIIDDFSYVHTKHKKEAVMKCI